MKYIYDNALVQEEGTGMIKRLIAKAQYLLWYHRLRNKRLFAMYCLHGNDKAVLERLGVIK